MLRSIKYGLHGAVVAGLIAVPVVWNSVDKTVDLTVDGRTTAIHTTDHTVGQVVAARGYSVTSHDLLAPSSASSIKDGSHIVLNRGRQLHLDIDGLHRDVWTTAPTVAAALSQLGYTNSDFVSVSRSRRLPLSATDVAIRTPRPVTVIHDGKRQSLTTTDATVGTLLNDLDITVGPMDQLSAPPSAALGYGATITLQRVEKRTVSRTLAVPFPTSRKKDSSLTVGTTKIVTPGKKGADRVEYSIVYIDGKAAGETRLDSQALSAPTPQVVHVGTKPKVANVEDAGTPDPGSAKAIAKKLLDARGWGDQYDCLVTLWNHESGWRVNAANPSGAYGIPQALPGSKMSSAGPNWQSDAKTQIEWGLGYIADRYHDPCGAWSTWQAHGGWY